MAHGAADHTQLSDDAFSHYVWKQSQPGSIVLAAQTYVDLVDLSLVGVLGGWCAQSDYALLSYEVLIDGVHLYSISASYLYTNKIWGPYLNFPYYGLGCYDAVNDRYVVWGQHNFKSYIHSALKIKCFNPDAGGAHAVNKAQLIYLER